MPRAKTPLFPLASGLDLLLADGSTASRALHAYLASIEAIVNDPDLVPEVRRTRLEDLAGSLEGTGIAPGHGQHLAQAAIRMAGEVRIESWSALLTFERFAAAPVAMALLDLRGERDATARRAAEALSMGIHILALVDRSRTDFVTFNRVFIPQDFQDETLVSTNRLAHATAEGQMRALLDRVVDGVDHLLAEAEPLARTIDDGRLRAAFASAHCLALGWAARTRRLDPMAEVTRPSGVARLACRLRGIWARLARR